MTAEEWGLNAACRNHARPDLWFPALKAEVDEAKRICRACPVRRACGDDAVDRDERHGVAAGYLVSDLHDWRQLRVWLGRPVPPRRPGANGPRTVRCDSCKQTFRTRQDVSRCPKCAQGLVPSAPARQRVADLRKCGLTVRQIAAAAGLSPSRITDLGRQQWIMPATEAAIFAVGAEATAVPA